MPFDQKPMAVNGALPGKVLVVGIDTLRETFDVNLKPQVMEALQDQKEIAQDIDYNGPASFMLGGETAVMGRPGKGVKFYVCFEGFDLLIRHTPNWNVTAWYRSGGIWQIGTALLRERAVSIVRSLGQVPFEQDADGVITEAPVKAWMRLTDVHVCVDLFAPELTALMKPGFENQFVLTSQCKWNTWGADSKSQTITLGTKKSVEISIYDKGREIREASGKTWFREIWDRSGYRVENFENIWRVEIRLAGDWLRDRTCFTWDAFEVQKGPLLQDALWSRRLTEPNGDANRARWPLHWLWQQVMLACAGELVCKPLGLRLQRDTEALPDMLKRQAAGVIRTAATVHKALNPYERKSHEDVAREMCADVKAMMFQDEEHEEKKVRTFERYRKIANPR